MKLRKGDTREWFLVMGRVVGDDDDRVFILPAENGDEAQARVWSTLTDAAGPDEDVMVSLVVGCGREEPDLPFVPLLDVEYLTDDLTGMRH